MLVDEARDAIEDVGDPRPRKRRVGRIVGIALLWVLLALAALGFGVGYWVWRTFGPLTIDQLLSNLGGGQEGAGGSGLVFRAIVSGVVIPLAWVGVLAVVITLVRRTRWYRSYREARPAAGRGLGWIAALLSVVLAVTGVAYLGSIVGAVDYARALIREATTDFGLERYVAEPEVRPANGADEKRNIVIIYLESIENAFSDDELFEKNMLEPVEDATEGWQSIDGYRQYEGGGWTMSGILSTQCGIPLRNASSTVDVTELNEMNSADGAEEPYLAGATCLGDVLKDQGYRNVFLGGADASFAGKGAFLSTHGYDEIDDLPYWKSLRETEIREDWGLSDRRLFDRARDKVDALHAGEQPFNLTMLSLDTHEGPRLYEYCEQDTEAVMTSITFCSMQQVARFVDYMDDQGYLEDTSVVLMGDHQKMLAEGGSFWKELKDRDHRSVFNRIWTPDDLQVARSDADQLSMYPTLLELAGLEIRDHRAGAGVSVFTDGSDISRGSILDLDAEEYHDLVTSRSVDFYRKLWSTPELD
ncbi:LTA synthase family protein [Leucobacter sp. USHLN153]|uniref:LTA synthase family protein n=1 Tax=Leucobacter sp. USHLN153 TaxID=3081268 RepID=UPI0030164936